MLAKNLMMAGGESYPEYINYSYNGYPSEASTYVADMPSGAVVGDLLIATFGINKSAAMASWPTNWTQLCSASNSGGSVIIGYHFVESGDGSSFSFTLSDLQKGSIAIAALKVKSINDTDYYTDLASGSSEISPAVTATDMDWFVVAAVSTCAYTETIGNSSGLSTAFSAGNGIGKHTLFYKEVSAGSTGTATITFSSTSDEIALGSFAVGN